MTRRIIHIAAIVVVVLFIIGACSALIGNNRDSSGAAGPVISSSTPIVRSTAPARQGDRVDPRALAAAKAILDAYKDDPSVTITPERLVYIVKQDCASRNLGGDGLSDDRLQREGFWPTGTRPPIGCMTTEKNNFGIINLYG